MRTEIPIEVEKQVLRLLSRGYTEEEIVLCTRKLKAKRTLLNLDTKVSKVNSYWKILQWFIIALLVYFHVGLLSDFARDLGELLQCIGEMF